MIARLPADPGRAPSATRARILASATDAIRSHGYSAATLDEVCEEAGVTKGALFHHFDGKEALALAAAATFQDGSTTTFRAADFASLPDAAERVLGYLDFRMAILQGEPYEYSCLLGTLVQEVHSSHPAIREACAAHMGEHVAMVAAHIAEAMKDRGVVAPWTAESLAWYTQAVLQGSFIVGKALGEREAALECIRHLRRDLANVFGITSDARRDEGESDVAQR